MKHFRMIQLVVMALPLGLLLLTFQNCGPAKLTMDGMAENASLGTPQDPVVPNPIGSKVDLTALLQSPQESDTNILFPSPKVAQTFDYAVGSPVLENVVLLKNDFTKIQWVHGPSETVVAIGDVFSLTEFTAAMEGIYYVIGYRGDVATRLTQFSLIKKTTPTVNIDATGALQFTQDLIFSDSVTETVLVQANAPTVDVASVQATLKPSGAVISQKRAFLVTKKTAESINAEFKILDTTGKVATKAVTLPAKVRPSVPTQTQILMLAQPVVNTVGGETVTIVPQFNALPMGKDYFVFIHFVDATGLMRTELTTNYTPVVPTSKWNGLIQFTVQIKVPSTIPAGTYQVRMGLYDNVGRATLEAGPGVVADTITRYTVGTLVKK